MLKKSFLWATLAISSFVISNANAEIIKYHGKTVDVQPLAGSQWAKDNPGILPYERCFLQDSGKHFDHLNRDRFDFLVYGYSSAPTTSESIELVCFSEKLNLGFRLPLTMTGIHHIGILADFTLADFDSTVSLHGLDGKTVSDLFGSFKGFEAGIGALVGMSGQFMKNKHGVRIANFTGNFEIGANMNYVGLHLERRKALYIHNHNGKEVAEGPCPLLLINGTENPRTEHDWYKRVDHEDENDPIRFDRDTTIDYSGLDPLKFVKIK